MRLATLALGCALMMLPAIQPGPAAHGLSVPVYYYRGHSYRYHHRGGYYNYYHGGRYYRHRNHCGGGWCYR